ncbi:hypothetical protein HanIR_Chr15g0752871 [Helianthus annuus]|nr:hypothetical protein HanIR_Chr15g0752871 [Helianthus annuus]
MSCGQSSCPVPFRCGSGCDNLQRPLVSDYTHSDVVNYPRLHAVYLGLKQ